MIKVSVLYPSAEGARFDLDYYLGTHIPMFRKLLGDVCKNVEIETGLSGAAPGSAPPFVAAAHMQFDSVDAFLAAFGPHAEAITGDVPKYTSIEPVVQIGQVVDI